MFSFCFGIPHLRDIRTNQTMQKPWEMTPEQRPSIAFVLALHVSSIVCLNCCCIIQIREISNSRNCLTICTTPPPTSRADRHCRNQPPRFRQTALMALLLASCLVGWLRLAGPLGSDLEVLLCLAVKLLSMRRSEVSCWAWLRYLLFKFGCDACCHARS